MQRDIHHRQDRGRQQVGTGNERSTYATRHTVGPGQGRKEIGGRRWTTIGAITANIQWVTIGQAARARQVMASHSQGSRMHELHHRQARADHEERHGKKKSAQRRARDTYIAVSPGPTERYRAAPSCTDPPPSVSLVYALAPWHDRLWCTARSLLRDDAIHDRQTRKRQRGTERRNDHRSNTADVMPRRDVGQGRRGGKPLIKNRCISSAQAIRSRHGDIGGNDTWCLLYQQPGTSVKKQAQVSSCYIPTRVGHLPP